MRILYIWDADYPWDVRVEKICQSLNKAGHEVHIVSRNLKKSPVSEVVDDLHIHRMKIWKNDTINYAFSFPAFFSPFWKSHIDSNIIEYAIDLIIVRDLPLAPAAIRAGKRHSIPVIFDMAEDYVAMIQDIWDDRKFQGLNLLVRNPYLAKLVEKYSFKNADHIIVVVEEAKSVVKNGGGDLQHISIVGNTPSLDSFSDQGEKPSQDLTAIKSRFSAIYTGGIQMGRGIHTVIEAIPDIIKEIPDFLFVIVGAGYAVERLQKETARLAIEDHVHWTGWIDHGQMYHYIKEANIGLIPHLVSKHVDTTIPNKLFDYMGHGLGVLASNAAPLQRIIEEEKCGMVFQSGDPEDFARQLIAMGKSATPFGENGKKAILNKYNWQNDEKRLLFLTENIRKKADADSTQPD